MAKPKSATEAKLAYDKKEAAKEREAKRKKLGKLEKIEAPTGAQFRTRQKLAEDLGQMRLIP